MAFTASFLIICLNIFRYAHVNNKKHIRFVNPHTKGDCGNHDNIFLAQEFILIFGSVCCIHSGMIRKCVESLLS